MTKAWLEYDQGISNISSHRSVEFFEDVNDPGDAQEWRLALSPVRLLGYD